MKLIINKKDGYVMSISIEYTPTEALVINHAMRNYVDNEEMNEVNRKIMQRMLDVEPIFRETESECNMCKKCLYADKTDGSHCYECIKGKSNFKAESEDM